MSSTRCQLSQTCQLSRRVPGDILLRNLIYIESRRHLAHSLHNLRCIHTRITAFLIFIHRQ